MADRQLVTEGERGASLAAFNGSSRTVILILIIIVAIQFQLYGVSTQWSELYIKSYYFATLPKLLLLR